MHGDNENENENENIMQVMGNRNLDEMRQQTLDALKVVQSFEAKPARSARVQELLAQKAHARQFVLSSARAKPAAPMGTAAQQRAAERPARHVLQPVKESASPEKRFASSPQKVPSAASSPARSPLHVKSSRVHEASPAKGLYAKRLRPAPSTAADTQRAASVRPEPQPEWRSSAAPPRPESQARASTQAAHATRRGPLVSSFRSVSRLLQPTAASAAKMRPVRAAMAPARADRPAHADQSSRADTSIIGARPTTTAARPTTTRPSTFAAKPAASSGSAVAKPTLPALGSKLPAFGSKHPLHTGGLSQFNPSHTKTLAFPSSGPSASPKLYRPAPEQGAGPDATSQAPKSLLSSVLTKTHHDKQPVEPGSTAQKGAVEPANHAKSTVLQPPLSVKPHFLAPTQSPAVTSTPVRVTPNTSVGEHTSGSFHSFDFTNFSFEAEWARTPELRKKVLEQKNDDTLQLFGHMPPINLESIFGAEMQRQRR